MRLARLLLTLLAASGAACPTACVCDAGRLEAACEGAALEAVPTPLSATLLRLSVADNLVATLADDALLGLGALAVLDLSRNRLRRLRGAPLRHTPLLTHLYVASNGVTTVDADAFLPLAALRLLDLSRNRLLRFPAPALRPLRHLRELRLQGNLLEAVEAGALAAQGRLRELRLGGNLLRHLDLGAAPELAGLDLADNNLTAVPTAALATLSGLTTLDLSGNAIASLEAGAFRGLSQLRRLRLCRLPALTGVHEDALLGVARLESLSLERNPRLRWLPPRLFHATPDLAELALRGCALRTLEARPRALRSLRLAGNPLTCNCSLRWLRRPAPGLVLDADAARCAAPEDAALRDAEEELFGCGATWGAVAVVAASVGALFGATCGLLLVIAGRPRYSALAPAEC